MAESIWPTVAAERAALADDLAHLTDEQWATASLDADWSVRQTLAHMTATARTNPATFMLGMVRSRFDFEGFSARNVAANLGATPQETLAAFRAVIGSTSAPPGPTVSWLGETIVHAEDIRRPLGIRHNYPIAAVRQVAEFYQGSNLLIGTRRRIEGVTISATDTDYEVGSGPVVKGPMLVLLLAMTGRSSVLDDLVGDGVEVLRGRD